MATGSSPMEAANCRRTFQFRSPVSLTTDAVDRRVALPQPTLRDSIPPHADLGRNIARALCRHCAGSIASRPSSVQSACSRVRQSGADAASRLRRRHHGLVRALDQNSLRRVAPPADRMRQRLHQLRRRRVRKRRLRPARIRPRSHTRRARCGRGPPASASCCVLMYPVRYSLQMPSACTTPRYMSTT